MSLITSGKFNGSVEGHHCTVAIGYSNFGYSGRAAYSDLNPVTNLRQYINSDLGYNDLKF